MGSKKSNAKGVLSPLATTMRESGTFLALKRLVNKVSTFKAAACLLGLLAVVNVWAADREDLFTRTFNGTYSITTRVDVAIQGDGMVDLLVCLPYPESNRYHTVFNRTIEPNGMLSYFPETGKPFLKYARNGKGMGTFSILSEYVVSLYKVEFDWTGVDQIYPYDTSADDYKTYTRQQVVSKQDNVTVQINHPWIQEQKDLILASVGSGILEYIRGAFLTVTTNFHYGASSSFDEAIRERSGDCGRLSAIFVSLLRAGGVPARQMLCMRPDGSPHVWAEFYLERYGWIPADVTFDLGRSENLENFGRYNDSCIVMTSDCDMSTESAGGVQIESFGIQGISWWWWYYGDKTELQLDYSFGGRQGMIDGSGSFVAFDELWHGWNDDANSIYTFDCNLSEAGNSGIGLSGGYSGFEKSPLGTSLKPLGPYGPWVWNDLQLPEEWTILTLAKVSATNDAVVFSMGGCGSRYGMALTSCGKDKVALSFWAPYSRHRDLLVADVPDASVEYHAYSFRVSGLFVDMFVDGSFVGTAKLDEIPVGALQFFGIIWGEGETGLNIAMDNAVDDWRLYNVALPDATIKNYAQLVVRYVIMAALSEMADTDLVSNVTNEAQYAAFRAWVRALTNDTISAQSLMESNSTWLSYALGSDALIHEKISSSDVMIESFSHSPTGNTWFFTVGVKDVNIGARTVSQAILEENLKKVLFVEGVKSIHTGVFSSDDIDVTFEIPISGKARLSATIPDYVGDSFFMRVKVKE